MKKFIYYILGFFLSCSLFIALLTLLFLPILTTDHLIFPYALNPFDICQKFPDTWFLIKIAYFISFAISYLIIYIFIVSNFQNYKSYKQSKKTTEDEPTYTSGLCLKIGQTENRFYKIYW